MLKLRKTAERSPTSMVIEPPQEINGSHISMSDPPRWRYLKYAMYIFSKKTSCLLLRRQAIGENVNNYGNRMDTMWAYRQAYEKASQIKASQDAYCAKAEAGLWSTIDSDFPESSQYEALVDVLRGRVKVRLYKNLVHV